MPGRLWVLFALQCAAAAFCCGLSRMGSSLGGMMALAVCMGLTVTAAAGATFGIVPFITRRGLGAANGIVGSGSSLGGWLFCLSGGREGGLHCTGRRPLHAVGCVARQQRQ
jgi:NNP family nitrate/nitrite transporter-like MFS transporter